MNVESLAISLMQRTSLTFNSHNYFRVLTNPFASSTTLGQRTKENRIS